MSEGEGTPPPVSDFYRVAATPEGTVRLTFGDSAAPGPIPKKEMSQAATLDDLGISRDESSEIDFGPKRITWPMFTTYHRGAHHPLEAQSGEASLS